MPCTLVVVVIVVVVVIIIIIIIIIINFSILYALVPNSCANSMVDHFIPEGLRLEVRRG
jgi:hypothetical protein